MSREFMLKVDPQLTFSVHVQIKEQLKWMIGIGRIKPGDMLPAANQLADLLGINRNTVNGVYIQLRDEGIVTIQKGRGTQVASNQAVAKLSEQRLPMHDLLTRTIDELTANHIELHEFFTASLAYTLLQGSKLPERSRLLLVECRDHDHLFYRDEIRRVTGSEVRTCFLEDVRASEPLLAEASAYASVVVTTLNHADEVRQLFRGSEAKIVVIGATVETASLLAIARMEPGTKVGFVCLGRSGGQWMASRVAEAGITQITPSCCGMNEPDELARTLAQADRVYASAAVYDKLAAMQPDKVALYPMLLEKSSESLLRDVTPSV